MKSPSYTLIDAEERNRAHPGTFQIPDRDEIEALKRGDWVKIGVDFDTKQVEERLSQAIRDQIESRFGKDAWRLMDGERFWVMLDVITTTPSGRRFTGSIGNKLVFAAIHGLDRDQIITFEACHILDIEPAEAGTA